MNKKLIIPAILVLVVIGGVGIFNSTQEQSPTETHTPTIGMLVPTEFAVVGLKVHLTQLGYVEGENIHYLVKIATNPQDYAPMTQALIDAEVDIITTFDAPSTLAVSNLTKTIPIVFNIEQTSFRTQIAPLINVDGRKTNLTGIISINPIEKRFEVMMQTVPSIKVIYVPYDPNNTLSAENLARIEAAALAYGVTVEKHEFSDDAGAQRALDETPQDIDAIFLGDEAPSLVRMPQWAELAIERKISLIVPLGQFGVGEFPSGALLGYGSGIQTIYQQGADLVDQILKGTPPANLPPRPSDTYLTVGVGMADILEITIPDDILNQASEIIYDKITQPSVAAEPEDGTACNATLVYPLGENSVCVTRSCGSLQNTGLTSFSNQVTVEACSTEGVLGSCRRDGVDTYFYDGDIALLGSGCTANGGTWSAPAE